VGQAVVLWCTLTGHLHACSGGEHRVSHWHLCGQSRVTARTGLCVAAARRGPTGGNHAVLEHTHQKTLRGPFRGVITVIACSPCLGLLPECSLVGPSRPVRGPRLDNRTWKICQNCFTVACCPCCLHTAAYPAYPAYPAGSADGPRQDLEWEIFCSPKKF